MKVDRKTCLLMNSVGYRASRYVWQTAKVNGKELNFLLVVCSYVSVRDLSQVSVNTLVKWIGLNWRARNKWMGYMEGCLKSGLLAEVINKKGTKSLVVTDRGNEVCDMYYDKVDELAEVELQRALGSIAA